MNVLDSPLEALAFNHLSFSFLAAVNNLWPCLAFLTAALSFWRIRASGYPKPQLDPIPDNRTSDPSPEVLTPADAVTDQRQPRPSFVSGSPVVGNGHVDGVTKGKFTVYYEDDGQCESDEVLTATAEEREERDGSRRRAESEWWESWDMLLRLRMGENENGWYTCQDLTAINGNVVRLWDGGLRESARYSSSCIHVW